MPSLACKNITSCTVGGTTLTGLTRFTVSVSRTVNPIHVDGDTYASCATTGPQTVEATLEGIDREQMQGFADAAPVTVVVTMGAADMTGAAGKIFTITDALVHSYTENNPEPGETATATLAISAYSTDGVASALALS